jgi:hypothetical protein
MGRWSRRASIATAAVLGVTVVFAPVVVAVVVLTGVL